MNLNKPGAIRVVRPEASAAGPRASLPEPVELEIPSKLVDLRERIEVLEKRVAHLTERVAPVLRAADPSTTGEMPKPARSQVGSEIQAACERISDITRTLCGVLETLEL